MPIRSFLDFYEAVEALGQDRPDDRKVDASDVQGIVLHSYGDLHHARYLLVQIPPPPSSSDWLRAVLPHVQRATAPAPSSAFNVAFTRSGLERLGLPEQALAAMPPAFLDGMTEPHRSEALSDVGESAPERWLWGAPHNDRVDAVLLVFADAPGHLEERVAEHTRLLEEAGGRVVRALSTRLLPGHREHFGFRSGIAQPSFASGAEERPGSLSPDHADNTVAPGELLLGYSNEYARIAPPLPVPASLDPLDLLPRTHSGDAALGKNGSFLAMRQLEQDVRAFWQNVRRAAPDEDPEWVAAKLMGRWRSGAPLVMAPWRDRPNLADVDDFGYATSDPHGYKCPFGAHIRRVNPRDWRLAREPATAVRLSKLHRIVRRGRPYGPPICDDFSPQGILDAPDDGEPRGLHFLCFQADLARQFEFVQQAWVQNGQFAAQLGERDAVLGRQPEGGGTFVVPATPVRERFEGLSSVVKVVGGAYFFAPSLCMLAYMANETSAEGATGGRSVAVGAVA